MRKLLLILFASVLLAVLSNTAIAQSFTTSSHSGITWARYNIWGSLCTDCQVINKEDSTGYAPFNASFKAGKTGLNKGTIISTPANHNSIPSPSMAMIAFDTTNKHFYGFNGTTWTRLDSAGGGGSFDTSTIYAQLALKVNYTDTAGMLANYATDAAVALKLNISDTGSMLSPYLRKIDTTELSGRIDLRVRYSDTASMLLPYQQDADTLAWDATLYDLRDTAAAIRADLPSLTGYVPYTGASSAVDLGIHNLTTTGRVAAATVRLTNPTSYSDVTSSATSPRSNTLPDRDGEIIVPSGTATNGYVIKSVSGTPTWQPDAGGGSISALTITTPLTGTSFDGSAPITIGLAGLTTLGTKNQVLAMNAAESGYEYHTAGGARMPGVNTSGSINGLATGATTLFTTNTGNGDFVVQQVIARVISVTGTPSTTLQSVIRWGGSTTIVSLNIANVNANAVGKYTIATPVAGTLVVPANTAIEINITVAHTVATVLTYQIDVIGYYTN